MRCKQENTRETLKRETNARVKVPDDWAVPERDEHKWERAAGSHERFLKSDL
jgi:hypothetical protein